MRIHLISGAFRPRLRNESRMKMPSKPCDRWRICIGHQTALEMPYRDCGRRPEMSGLSEDGPTGDRGSHHAASSPSVLFRLVAVRPRFPTALAMSGDDG